MVATLFAVAFFLGACGGQDEADYGTSSCQTTYLVGDNWGKRCPEGTVRTHRVGRGPMCECKDVDE